jgi:hypothetical protein
MKKANRKPPNPPRPQASRGAPWGQCYCAGAGPRLTALTAGVLKGRLSGPVFDHFQTASMEVLLGLRALLDAQIESLSRRSRKGTRVPVE